MSEFFIVLSHQVTRHEELEQALQEKSVLEKHVPDRTHTIFRCKSWLHGAKHFSKAVALLADIQRDGLTESNKDQLRLLLFTIGNRTPRLKTLMRVEGPPEYRPSDRMPPNKTEVI